MTAFFVLLSAASASVAALRWRTWPRRRWLLVLWALGCALCAVFRTDPGGVPVHARAYVHGFAAMLAFASLWICALATALAQRGRRLVPTLVSLAVPLGIIGARRIGFGAAERWMIAVDLAWLGQLLVDRSERASTDPSLPSRSRPDEA
jgi:hypothetical protein